MEGFDEILEALTEQINAIPASFTSIWIWIQLGLIAVAALIGWALAAYLRRRIDVSPYIADWPAPLRRAIRVASPIWGSFSASSFCS